MLALLALSALLVVGVAGCGGGDRLDGSAAAQGDRPHDVSVASATIDWPANPRVAAVHMQVTNGTAKDDRLLAVTSPVARTGSIHRSVTDDQGRATMEPQDGVTIPARSTVTFEPGGLHVMLTGLRVDLEVGDEVTLDLTFERAGPKKVLAEVVEPGSADDTGGSHDH
jgi:copper(I)-binding protein